MTDRILTFLLSTHGCIKVSFFCLGFVTAVALSGCASHKKTTDHVVSGETPPPLSGKKMLKQWRHVSREHETPSSEAGPLTVDRVITEALHASPELEQIRQRVAAADEQIRRADASFYPRLVASERFNSTNNPVHALMNIINQRRLKSDVNFNDPGTQQDFATRIRADWSLFEGGSRYYGRQAAVGYKESLQGKLMSARNQLVAKVVETYYHWLQAMGFIGVARDAYAAADTDVRLTEARLKAEMALPSEVMRLKAHRAEMHGNLVTAETGARRLQAALERLLARPIHKGEIPDPAVHPPDPPPKAPLKEDSHRTDALVGQALSARPELASVRAMILAAENRIRAARGGLLPRLGVGAEYQWNTETFSEVEGSWLVDIGATWSLFEGGATLSRIREARVRLKEIEAKGEQMALDIALEVHQATLAVREAVEKVRVAAERRKWAEMALQDVRRRYRNQMATVDTLLQSEVSFNQADVSYTAALYEGKIAQVLLRQTLGDFADWKEDANG